MPKGCSCLGVKAFFTTSTSPSAYSKSGCFVPKQSSFISLPFSEPRICQALAGQPHAEADRVERLSRLNPVRGRSEHAFCKLVRNMAILLAWFVRYSPNPRGLSKRADDGRKKRGPDFSGPQSSWPSPDQNSKRIPRRTE
jgi:hypothetical protein